MVFKDQDDFNLCNKTWQSITNKYSQDSLVTDFPYPERVVVIVWTVSGILENGGFRYLFSSDLPGDPSLQLTLDAFERIGCLDSVQIIKRSLCLFPSCERPGNTEECIREFENIPKDIRQALDIEFCNELDNITKCLADYIRNDQFLSSFVTGGVKMQ